MSNKLSDLTSLRTKGTLEGADRFYVVGDNGTPADDSRYITATELMYFAGGDVTSSNINGRLVIGNEKVTKAMLADDARRADVVDITAANPNISAASHANKVLRVTRNTGTGSTLTFSNTAGFLAGDVVYVIQYASKPVTFAGSGGITVVTSRSTPVIDEQYATARVTFVTDTLMYIDFATDFIFDIADYPAETSTPAPSDEIVINDGSANSRMKSQTFKSIGTHTIASGNLDLGLTRVNQTIIVQTTAGNTSLLELQKNEFEIGDWITVLPTGDGTVKITTEATVSVYTTGETANADYKLEQYGFVTAYMFEANKWVLLGPVEKV